MYFCLRANVNWSPKNPAAAVARSLTLTLLSTTCVFVLFLFYFLFLKQRERFLRHSDTGPGPACDWPSADLNASPTGARSFKDSSTGCARPRAWSVRTFQDFLPPLPQLHKKWCSWNSTSPFTKLVDSVSTWTFAVFNTEELLHCKVDEEWLV